MIDPGEALCGLMFADAEYFSVGKIDTKQLLDYAAPGDGGRTGEETHTEQYLRTTKPLPEAAAARRVCCRRRENGT